MEILIKLFLVFFKIGAFSFGGGYAMLPFMQKEIIENNGFIGIGEFLDIVGISQMTPGPIAINSATFVGVKVQGILGAVFATVGVVTASLILVLIVSKFLKKFKENEFIKGALIGMRPVLVALIVKAFLDLAKVSYMSGTSIFIGVIIGFLVIYKKVNPILCIGISGILGLLIYGGI
ncbi:MAG: chromate transporter [Clostridium sp.]|uniref:chromate transporter n=1 Tax=Clostridium sp. TaxID=1506 RepID=UPI003F2E1BD3